MNHRIRQRAGLVATFVLVVGARPAMPALGRPANCQKMQLAGEVLAGQEWKSPIGQGWVFRVLPIGSGYSGWDLVVDSQLGEGFPDALMLATPPYGSINEREIGTTFGVRAQDAIGWNPRSFKFLTDPHKFNESQQLFKQLPLAASQKNARNVDSKAATALMKNLGQASAGQFRILDARLTPGVADAAPFAEPWALASAKTPHTVESVPQGHATPMGTLNWMRFSVTLWMPADWQAPTSIHTVKAVCSQ